MLNPGVEPPASPAAALRALLAADPLRWRLLGLVAGLGLPDAWVAAGCIRDAVWAARHGRAAAPAAGDVDVVWFDPGRAAPAEDRRLEAMLRARAPGIPWSVKNQARMHARNGDAPYASVADAMRRWPETATAVAARRGEDGCEIAAPFGLEDLFGLVLRPTPAFAGPKRPAFEARVRHKGWCATWPRLRLAPAGDTESLSPAVPHRN